MIRDVTAEITREIELPHLLRLIQRHAMDLVHPRSSSTPPYPLPDPS